MRGKAAHCIVLIVLGVVPFASSGTAVRSAAGAGSSGGKKKPVNLDTDPHLMGWWKFDDKAGKIAADSSKHGRKGKLMGGLTFGEDSAPGRSGKALKLEGGDGYIEITKYKGVTGTKPRTICAWIKTQEGRGEIMAWGKEEGGSFWVFRIVRSGIRADPKGGYLYSKSSVHDDKWHHVAVVVGEAETPTLHDDVTLYKDGEVQEIHDIGLLHMYSIDTEKDIDVRIGRGLKGLLDDVRLYDRALTDKEIKALFRLKNAPEK